MRMRTNERYDGRYLSMLFSLALFMSALSLNYFLHPACALGQDGDELSSDGAYSLVDNVVTIDITPAKVIVLQEPQLGLVQQYDGEFSYFSQSESKEMSSHQLLASARVLWNFGHDYKAPQKFVFLFYDSKGHFAATPVASWSYEQAKEHALTEKGVKEEISILQQDIELAQNEVASLDVQLEELRERAASIAEVDKIVDLKVELAQLTSPEEEEEMEFDRLSSLVERGYQFKCSNDVDVLRAELNNHLVEMSKATALADRLSHRKGQSAVERVKQKLRLIRDTKDIDANELARQVLDMRTKRREYEQRMGIRSGDNEADY